MIIALKKTHFKYSNSHTRLWKWRLLLVLLVPALVLVGCNPSGDSGSLSPPTEPSPSLERQAVSNVLEEYRKALLHEDIDRLQTLLEPEGVLVQGRTAGQQRVQRQEQDGALPDVQTFRDARSADFRAFTVTDLQILMERVQMAADQQRVTFLEVESVEEPAALAQHTRLWRTTLALTRDEAADVVTFRISAGQREGPLVQVTTLGQIQAGALTRVVVAGTGEPFVLTGVVVEVPDTGMVQALEVDGADFRGLFTPPMHAQPQPLWARLQGASGEELVLQHRYRLRRPDEGVVQPIAGAAAAALRAVTVAPDGTVWAGGDGGAPLYSVPSGTTTATLQGPLLADHPAGRVADLTLDALGRLHAVVVAPQASGVIVFDQGVLCQTVNVWAADGTPDPAYPFRVRDPQGRALRPSPSTRAAAAAGGAIWLFGSDGGVAQVTDTFRAGQYPERNIGVRYDPLFRRDTSGVLANTVPALVLGTDGTLWFGTALGLTRLRDGQFTALPFAPVLSLQGRVETLEAFFQEVAAAIFTARPIETVALGDVSFVEEFGRALVKEDFIWSAVEDSRGRLWVGTLGGGLRRIEGDTQAPRLTRQDGLGSNIIFALATGPDGTLWAATDAGVSRLQEANGTLVITNFSAVDGLKLPVRDVAVDRDGVAGHGRGPVSGLCRRGGSSTAWCMTPRGALRRRWMSSCRAHRSGP